MRPEMRQEFEWVVDLDDPAQAQDGHQKPMFLVDDTDAAEPQTEEEAQAAQAATVRSRAVVRNRVDFMQPVLMAVGYIATIGGLSWWLGG